MKKLIGLMMILGSIGLVQAQVGRMIALPDTQKYSQDNPNGFSAQTQWIANNVSALNIDFVTHLGDVVNNNEAIQWQRAEASIDILDGVVPYSVSMGNHDLDVMNDKTMGYSAFVSLFGPDRYSGYSWYGGAARRGASHYQIVNIGGVDILHINLEYCADDEMLLWAQRVMEENPTLPVILSTHSLITDNPEYVFSGAPDVESDSNATHVVSSSGTDMWWRLIKSNDQIFMTLNGHVYNYGGERLITYQNDYGNDVHMMCANYQGPDTNYGDGWLRIYEFDFANNKIDVKTYSPTLDQYQTDEDSQFTLNIDFSTRWNFGSRENIDTVQAANIKVIQNDTFNNYDSITMSIPEGESTDKFFLQVPLEGEEAGWTTSSTGDYQIRIGDNYWDDSQNGITIASVANNGRKNFRYYDAYQTVSPAVSWGHGQISLSVAMAAVQLEDETILDGGNEDDVDVTAAYFPFDSGWIGAQCKMMQINPSASDPNESHNKTWAVVGNGIVLGENLIQFPNTNEVPGAAYKVQPTSGTPNWGSVDTDRGVWDLFLPGVDSMSDGVLLVTAHGNEDNYASASPYLDGSGWQIAVKDNGGGGATEADNFGFVYVPYDTEGIVAGRVSGRGGVLTGTGGFSVRRLLNGRHALTIDGYTPQDGALLLTGENEWYNDDDILTYEASGDQWIIENRDLPEANLTNSTQAQYVFVFIPFDNPPAEPGAAARAFDYTTVLGANFAAEWSEPNDFVNISKLNGSDGFEDCWHNEGLYYYMINGKRPTIEAGMLMATIREFGHDDDDGRGFYVPTVHSREGWFGVNAPTGTKNSGYSANRGTGDLSVVWVPRGAGFTWGDVRDSGALYVNGDYGNCYEGSEPVIEEYQATSGRWKYTFGDITPADGVLFTMSRTDAAGITASRPLADGWEVTKRSNYCDVDTYINHWTRYLFMPYQNDIGAIVAAIGADGTKQGGSSDVTVSKIDVGTYRVSIAGVTPSDGSILADVYDGDEANGTVAGFAAYEPDGNDFIVKCFNLQSPREEIDTGFAIAFVPFVSGYVEPVYEYGDGTLDNPYQIFTQEQLEAVSLSPASAYVLMNDIDLAGTTYSAAVIASLAPFTGHFDGDGFTISNLTIDASVEKNVGLFGNIGTGGYVMDVNVANADITADEHAGGIAGEVSGVVDNCTSSGTISANYRAGGLVGYIYVGGSVINSSSSANVTGELRVAGLVADSYQGASIDNCFATGTVIGTGNEYAGGLVGQLNDTPLTNSYATGDVSASQRVGGLVGNNYKGSVTNCYATGNVTATGTNYAGGLIGQHHTASVADSYATGKVYAPNTDRVGGVVGNSYQSSITNCYAEGNVTGNTQVGGVVGYNDGTSTPSTVFGCYAIGNVHANSNYGGGVAGQCIDGTIDESYALGNVYANYEAGGFVGRHSGTGVISNCFAWGSVNGNDRVGGFSGGAYGTANNCYSVGAVSGGANVGGFTGLNNGNGNANNCFWDMDTSGLSITATAASVNAEGKSTVLMQTQSTFIDAGWDFTSIWQQSTGSYPVFEWHVDKPEPTADLNTDGVVDVDDLVMLMDNWLVQDGVVGDINGDDAVDLLDFAILAFQSTAE